jgi:hypothetical protein
VKQIEEDEVRVEQQEAADAAARVYEDTRRTREALQWKCLLGLVDFSRQRRTVNV